ncbi:hypothetical protein BS50DRAFT_675438 [Corynespora cassiicola Philippines]|uniref:Uncharacterized protein n=1 Tax=Corynespora cassiicola Philippines TaxID=1448308 RepID=A0A2T2NV25_CORCC|nr:hypothetical protein BS50DRAFT_675438 [Corynespora cassiicola Philippines]
MAWWRRDPSIWCRSPIHRYTNRALRDNEAAIRTRCFSRSKPSSAQHKDDDDSKRPQGLTNLQWLQLQHYRRWKKRLQDDPYRALFGASEDMLKGKGLKDWHWVYKSFPKWVFEDQGDGEAGNAASRGKRDRSADNSQSNSAPDATYPKKVKLSDEELPRPKGRIFPEPSFRSSRFERDDYRTGVSSPSDTRRPGALHSADQPTHTHKMKEPDETEASVFGQDISWKPETSGPREEAIGKGSHGASDSSSRDSQAKDANSPKEEASVREASFIEEFLVQPPTHEDGFVSKKDNEKEWRQTVLQRRVEIGESDQPNTKRNPQDSTFVDATFKNGHLSTRSEQNERFQPAMANRGQSPTSSPPPAPAPIPSSQAYESDWYIRPTMPLHKDTPSEIPASPAPRRSTAGVLRQLPEDDLDLLSAADIRASMGRKRANSYTFPTRQELEKNYKEVQLADSGLHPLIESKIVSDQHVRRKERALQSAQTSEEAQEIYQESKTQEPATVPESTPEYDVGPLTRWLHRCGDVFARNFWQEPITAANSHINLPDHFVRGIKSGVRIDRDARKQIEEDLAEAVPASKTLLTRLKADDEKFDTTLKALQTQRFNPMPMNYNNTPRNKVAIDRRVQELRDHITQTHELCSEALRSLDHVENDTLRNSERLQRKLVLAAEVVQKSYKLTRAMIFGLQARLKSEKEAQDERVLLNFLDHLLAIQDTKLALGKVIDRAMHVYGVLPSIAEKQAEGDEQNGEVSSSFSATGSSTETSQSPTSEANPASKIIPSNAVANKQLQDEIQAQKTAMRGLSDDGYSRPPKEPTIKSFTEPNPLANSLFRPFSMQFESLGKDVDTEAEKTKASMKLKLDDQKLVREVRRAYEDIYGPITIHHRQFAGNDRPPRVEVEKAAEATSSSEDVTEKLQENSHEAIPAHAVIDEPVMQQQSSVVDPTPQVTEEKTNSVRQTDNDVSKVVPATVLPETSPVEESSASKLEKDKPLRTEKAAVLDEESDCSGLDGSINYEIPEYTEQDAKLAATSTTYEILTYDAQNDELSIITSTAPGSRDTSPPIPLHEALSILENPAKFIPHIKNWEVVRATPTMLALRTDLDAAEPTSNIRTVKFPVLGETEGKEDEWKHINPVDGTTRLSPTGFVGNGVEVEELERDFEERRRMADEHSKKFEEKEPRYRAKKDGRERKGGGAASVLKTAIVATAGCYIVGVIGELLR